MRGQGHPQKGLCTLLVMSSTQLILLTCKSCKQKPYLTLSRKAPLDPVPFIPLSIKDTVQPISVADKHILASGWRENQGRCLAVQVLWKTGKIDTFCRTCNRFWYSMRPCQFWDA